MTLFNENEKTRLGREKSLSPIVTLGVDTQGAHNSLMAKKLWNQHVSAEKTSEPWPPITNRTSTTAHCATVPKPKSDA
jgi:hypothetical protein